MHLLYVSGQKHDYIGYCKFGPEKLLTQKEPVRLEQVCLVTALFNPQNGSHALNQMALSSDNWFKEDLWLNPQNMADAREMPNDSSLSKSYKASLEKVRVQKSGICLVKAMPGNLPPKPNLN